MSTVTVEKIEAGKSTSGEVMEIHGLIFWPGDAEDYEPPAQRVARLIPAFGIVEIYGPPNCGKTAFAMDLAACIARGTDFRGRRIADGGGLVIYVAAENPGSAKLRLKAYVRTNPDSVEMPFAIASLALNLGDEASVTHLVRFIEKAALIAERDAVAVFIDTLAAAMLGLDENHSRDMGMAIAGLTRLRDATKGVIVVIHHSGKDLERGGRGSNALKAAVDTEISITGTSGTRTATVVKQRDLPTGATFDFTLEAVTVGFEATTHDSITAVVVKHGEESTIAAKRRPTGTAQIAILNAMEADEAGKVWTRDQIRVAVAAAGITHRNSIRAALDKLIEDKFIIHAVAGYRLNSCT